MKADSVKKLINTFKILESSFDLSSCDLISDLSLQSGKNKYIPRISTICTKKSVTYKIDMPGFEIKGEILTVLDLLTSEMAKYDNISLTFNIDGVSTVINAGDNGVKIKRNENTDNKANSINHDHFSYYGMSTNREYFINVTKAVKLLREIGILDGNNKIRNDKIRKYNQIDRFVEFADENFKRLDFGKRDSQSASDSVIEHKTNDSLKVKKKTLTILDCACGKSYLSFVLYYYFNEVLNINCKVTGLDIFEAVIESSKKTATRLDYNDMEFITADLREYKHVGISPDFCISLHGCDVATDYAIFTGIKSKSRIIMCVPCCQKEVLTSNFILPEFSNSLMKHGILKVRFSDIMTDAIRALILEACGYDVKLVEYISPLDSPKNLLISAIYTGKRNIASINELIDLKKNYKLNITLETLLAEELGL